jgi:hypothetical protein
LVAKPGAAEVSRLHLPVNSGEALEQRDSFARIVQGPLDASPTEL